MIFTYGGSFIGHMHEKTGKPCQDYSYNGVLENGSSLLVVADGVGSSKHSEIASKIAVETVVDVVRRNPDTELLTVLKMAYQSSNDAILRYADEHDGPVSDYDTTLTAAVYDGDIIVYGHSGDGGIIAIRDTGEYMAITEPQKGFDATSVIPLRAGESFWKFGIADITYSAVAVATDGVLDVMMPGLLKLTENPVYVAMLKYFADNNVLKVSGKNIDYIIETRLDFINGPDFADISDDRTIVVAINSDKHPIVLESDYYSEPDWEKLSVELRKKAYPHLYAVEGKKYADEESEEAEELVMAEETGDRV